MTNIAPRIPRKRTLAWNDAILNFQETLQDLPITQPLYIVGGAVRDAFLSRQIKDLDLATPKDAIKTARLIANHLKADIYVLDEERDVARIILKTDAEPMTIDVARFRGDTLLDDLYGRDFTINAMAVDLSSDLTQIIDPLDGETHADQRTLARCMPDSLSDDPIRILRAIRQSVQLGFRIHPDTTNDIRTHGHLLDHASAERIRDEVFAMLATPKPSAAFRIAQTLGILEWIMPELSAMAQAPELWALTLETMDKLANLFMVIGYQRTDHTAASFAFGILTMQLDRFRPKLNAILNNKWSNGRPHSALLMLSALLHMSGTLIDPDNAPILSAQLAEERADALRLSSIERKRLVGTIAFYQESLMVDYQSDLALHRYWYAVQEMGVDACLLGLASYLAIAGIELSQDEWVVNVERATYMLHAFFNDYERVVSPELLINGSDLMETFGLPSSPIIGELLTIVREAQVTGAIQSVEEALQLVERYLQ